MLKRPSWLHADYLAVFEPSPICLPFRRQSGADCSMLLESDNWLVRAHSEAYSQLQADLAIVEFGGGHV